MDYHVGPIGHCWNARPINTPKPTILPALLTIWMISNHCS